MARQPAGRLPKRLMDGKLVGGEDPGKGRPEQNWMDCLKDDFQAFRATDGSTVDNRLTFGVDRTLWTLAAKMDDGASWHKGAQWGVAGSGNVHDLLTQGRRGGQPMTCDQTRLS